MRHNSSKFGYTLWLSAEDTRAWACKPGAAWPGSTLSGKRIVVEVDRNGLVGLTVNGRTPTDPDIGSGGELEAIVSDSLPGECLVFWPVWKFSAPPAVPY